jgi:hypothetical protein
MFDKDCSYIFQMESFEMMPATIENTQLRLEQRIYCPYSYTQKNKKLRECSYTKSCKYQKERSSTLTLQSSERRGIFKK